MSTQRAFVTGASGFIGANLARRLLHEGREVHLLLRPGRDDWRLDGLKDAVTIWAGSVEDRQAVAAALAVARPHEVYHLAAYGAYPVQDDLAAAVTVNVLGCATVLEAALEQSPQVSIVVAGSSSEYGFCEEPPPETKLPRPSSHYAATKAGATLLAGQLARVRGARICTLRLYSVYGPYEEPTRFIPQLISHGLENRLPPLAAPDTARDFVHVDDVVAAFLSAATATGLEPGEVLNVGTGVQTTLAEAVEMARLLLRVDQEPKFETMPPRAWDTAAWVANANRIRERLGWRPRLDFQDGLQSTIDWFRGNPAALERCRAVRS